MVIGRRDGAVGPFPVLVEGWDLSDTGTADDYGFAVLYGEEVGEGYTDPTSTGVVILLYARNITTQPSQVTAHIELGVLGHLFLTLESKKLHGSKILSEEQDEHLGE
jgi:hypothetical protein